MILHTQQIQRITVLLDSVESSVETPYAHIRILFSCCSRPATDRRINAHLGDQYRSGHLTSILVTGDHMYQPAIVFLRIHVTNTRCQFSYHGLDKSPRSPNITGQCYLANTASILLLPSSKIRNPASMVLLVSLQACSCIAVNCFVL